MLPWHIAQSRGVGSDVEDHREEDDTCPGLRVVRPFNESTVRLPGQVWSESEEERPASKVGHTVERDTGEDQAEDHARRAEDHDPSPTNLVNPLEGNEGEDEVGPGYDEANCCRLIETDGREESGRIVHESVETTKLLEGLQTAGNDWEMSAHGRGSCRDEPSARRFTGSANMDLKRCQNVVVWARRMLWWTAACSTFILRSTSSDLP